MVYNRRRLQISAVRVLLSASLLMGSAVRLRQHVTRSATDRLRVATNRHCILSRPVQDVIRLALLSTGKQALQPIVDKSGL